MDQVAKPTWILRKFHMDTIKVILLNLWRFEVKKNLGNFSSIQYFHSYKNSVFFFQELFMSTTPVTIQPTAKNSPANIHPCPNPPTSTPSQQIRTSAKSRRTGLSLKADSTSLGLCRIEAFPKRQRNLGERWKKRRGMILFFLTIEWRQVFMDTIGKSVRFIVFFVGDKIITTLKCWYVSYAFYLHV